MRSKYNDPYVTFGGDFNRRSIQEATKEYPDLKLIPTGPTRGNTTLDLLASNFNDNLIDAGTLDSIFNEVDVATDHTTVYSLHRMSRGLSEDKLVLAYKTLIRPSVEYLAPVWAPMITSEQSELLERQQMHALKTFLVTI